MFKVQWSKAREGSHRFHAIKGIPSVILRPYQKRIVDNAEKALKKHNNTLVCAPTGAGKTVIMAALADRMGGRTLVLQHRDVLLSQNMSRFQKTSPLRSVSVFNAGEKSWRGDTVFAMQETLWRHVDAMPSFDFLVVDETHHIVSPTYRKIIDAAKEKNPGMMLSGFTATPARADRRSLRAYFDNVADKITLRELIGQGFLVPPKAFIVDIGVREQLEAVGPSSDFGDQTAVENILNTIPINTSVVRNWQEKAEGRQTIAFTASVKHARDVAQAFNDAGIKAEVISGSTTDTDRRALLARFDNRQTRVIVNCAVLVEGFDSPIASCIVLLRQSSSKSPLLQMAGRGLRIVDPERYPGVSKLDCVLIDFGLSLLIHGNLDAEDGLHKDRKVEPGEAVEKTCPTEDKGVYIFPDRNGNIGCGAKIPAGFKVCPLCEFEFQKFAELSPEEVNLIEFDLVAQSPFRWVNLFDSENLMMATGFSAWAGIFTLDGDTWHALGKLSLEKPIHKLAVTGRLQALAAADDFLRRYETDDAAKKGRGWLNQPATEKQLGLLRSLGYEATADVMGNSAYTKYSASCHTNFSFNRHSIEKALGV
jgi:superfamily II DNA or RNA helicase